MDALPASLKALSSYQQFVVYKVTHRLDSNGQPLASGKTDKTPIDPATGYNLKWNAPGVLMTASAAIAANAAISQKLSKQWLGHGIGFVFMKNDPFCFIDIDNCIVQSGGVSDWSPLAKKIMARFPNAAMEVSLSNKGLHIIFCGEALPHSSRNKEHNIEFYTDGHFVALTGINATGDAKESFPETLPSFIAEFFPPTGNNSEDGNIAQQWQEQVNRGVHPNWDGSVNDDELIECMLNCKPSPASIFGDKISNIDLWRANETALAEAFHDDNRNHDANRADASLAQRLAFWTGNDPELRKFLKGI